MKSAVEFYLSFLVEGPQHRWLVVCPSVSPENSPAVHPESSIAAGTTMDNQLLFDLFTKTIKSAEILKTDKELAKKMILQLMKLINSNKNDENRLSAIWCFSELSENHSKMIKPAIPRFVSR